jgi:hypothetical protein
MVGLVVRFQHLHPIRIGLKANVGNKRTTGKFVILVEFPNSTFDPDDDIERVSNVEFIPLVFPVEREGARRRQGVPF